MTAYVVDASVAAKWVLPSRDEPLAAEAARLLGDYAAGALQLSVPDLFWPEIANILLKATRAGRISEESAHESIRWFDTLGLRTLATQHLAEDALAIAPLSNGTVYDAVYVALAVASGGSLITADERLVRGAGAQFPIRWLGSLV